MASPSMWKCAGCGAPNPMSRDACYNCQTSRFSDQTQAVTSTPPIPDPGAPSQPSPSPPSDPGNVVPAPHTRVGTFAVSPKLIAVAVLVLLVVGALVIRAVEIRAAERKRIDVARDAVSALQAIGSALKVGLNLNDYQSKLIDAQTKIDAYTSKYGWLGFEAAGKKMCAAQRAYTDAAALWQYEHDDKAKTPDLGEDQAVLIKPNTRMYDVCSGYPGALDKALPGDDVVTAGTILAENAKQAMWADADIMVEDLATTIGR